MIASLTPFLPLEVHVLAGTCLTHAPLLDLGSLLCTCHNSSAQTSNLGNLVLSTMNILSYVLLITTAFAVDSSGELTIFNDARLVMDA